MTYIYKAIGPFDYKVFGQQKAFIKRSVEFVIRNENAEVQEIFVLSKLITYQNSIVSILNYLFNLPHKDPKGSFISFNTLDKNEDGQLLMEFMPEEIGNLTMWQNIIKQKSIKTNQICI